MPHKLTISVSDQIYESLKRHKLLDHAADAARDGLINAIIIKMNKGEQSWQQLVTSQ